MDGKCEGCGADMTIQRTHWDGCHTTHKQCAAFKAGREAGMREAGKDAERWRYWRVMPSHWNWFSMRSLTTWKTPEQLDADTDAAILSAIDK